MDTKEHEWVRLDGGIVDGELRRVGARMASSTAATVVADSDATIVVEGNHYFPLESVKRDLLSPSDTRTTCPWKGVASYYTLAVDGRENRDAVWYYPEPMDAAKQITGRVAFWKGVKVTE